MVLRRHGSYQFSWVPGLASTDRERTLLAVNLNIRTRISAQILISRGYHFVLA